MVYLNKAANISKRKQRASAVCHLVSFSLDPASSSAFPPFLSTLFLFTVYTHLAPLFSPLQGLFDPLGHKKGQGCLFVRLFGGEDPVPFFL